ncbi:MAG TPA: SDR family NAD(P)-dependent oxidoreductase [Ktedonobacterales bacterium]|nr:SDR family NAD(P)-dependent oxidoreductase [Ktedonobacterales bacterium]
MPTRTIQQLFDLAGKVTVVTGAGRGIGLAIAGRLAEAGASVMIADLDGDGAQRAAEQLRGQGRRVSAVQADIGNADQARAAVQATVDAFGGLDILINNAGIFPFAAVLHTPDAMWERTLAVNLCGAFVCAQAAAQSMVAAGHGGRMVNIASVSALRPSGNLAHYDASKAGLLMLTKSLAREFAQHSITVNAVAPGEIDTPGTRAASTELAQEGGVPVDDMASPEFLARIPLGRLGTPDDVALAVLFLASGAADYITGACLVVDGGYLLT